MNSPPGKAWGKGAHGVNLAVYALHILCGELVLFNSSLSAALTVFTNPMKLII
jgi:hypothetical protein